jgi:hypothetical protein
VGVRQIGAILLGLTLLASLAGCREGHPLANEIAVLRKGGDAAGARQKAVAAVTEKPQRMEVWRELAYCDEVLYRDISLPDDERMGLLVESSLLCAAICGHNDGKAPDDSWKAVCTQVAGHLRTCRQGLLDQVTIRPDIRQLRELNRPKSIDELMGRDEPLTPGSPYTAVIMEADPLEAHHAVYWYARLYPLSWRVPHAADTEPGMRETALKRLEGWADNRHVPLAMVTYVYTAGEQVVNTAYTRALEDLQNGGYFQVSTIVNNGILEP